MDIQQKELDMLLLLDSIINDSPAKDVGISMFWLWNDHLYQKYGIDKKTQYIEHDGMIVTRDPKEKED